MYLGHVSKNQGAPAKIAAGVYLLLEDEQQGRRSLRWLAERSGIPYSTLQLKLSKTPEKFTLAELFRIADALSVELPDLYAEPKAA